MRLPVLVGAPVQVRLVRAPRDRRGPVDGGAFLRRRRIVLDADLAGRPAELTRILIHELFHFAWLRLGNPLRRSWEELLADEWAAGVPGELGWSAEWRKRALAKRHSTARTRRWREYCCESFCDTAAWLFAGLRAHPDFTLPPPHRACRRQWFIRSGVTRRISI